MNYKITGYLLSSLFVISACTSSSKTPDPGVSDPQTPDAEIPDGNFSNDGENILRISTLSESVGSFEGVVNIGWFGIDESNQIPDVNSSAVFFEVGSDNAQVNPVTDYLFFPG